MRFIHAAAAAALIAACAAPAVAAAQNVTTPSASPIVAPMQGTLLSVSADGKTEARPDMALISMGVATEGATAAEALSQNATRMTALMQALRRAGVAERDVQTSNVSVNPQYVYGEGVPPRITSYQANNQVTARVRDLDRLGRIIDAAVNAGGNTVNGVSFTFQEPEAQMDTARTNAIEVARRRANLYAQALGMRVHRIVSVNEAGGWAPPMPMPMMERMAMAQDASTPIAPGEVETRVNVNVVFELR